MNIDLIAQSIREWADQVFPDRTDASMFLKFFGEANELLDAGDDPHAVAEEVADLMILLLDYAKRKGVKDITGAILAKMRVNRHREWVVTPSGVMQHADKD